MARKKAKEKAKDKLEEVAEQVGYPEARDYLKQLADDSDLRDNLERALDSSKRVFDQLGSKRKRGKLINDEKFQAEVQEALDALRNAVGGVSEAPKKAAKKGRGKGRKLFILVLGGGLALVGSESLRSKVLDALFGAEEEFEYAPPPPPPASSPAAVPAVAPKAAEPEPDSEPEPAPAPTESSDAETASEAEDSTPDGAA